MRKESSDSSSVFSDKGSPLFRPRALSRAVAGNAVENGGGSSGSSRFSSVSRQLLRKSSNRIADSSNQILMQVSEGHGQLRSVSPVRYESPPGASKPPIVPPPPSTSFASGPTMPTSTVYTIDGQMAQNAPEPTIGVQNSSDLMNKAMPEDSSITTSGARSTISFKNLTLISTRLKSEMSDSRVKLNALNYDLSTNRIDERLMDDISEGTFIASSSL